ncbi:MAG: PAS domain S-box protein [Planctomycetota bacterium]
MATIRVIETAVDGIKAGAFYPIPDREPLTIGSSEESAVSLDDARVCPDHCHIEKTDGGYRVVDRGSRSGTLVNRRPVSEAVLKTGDLIIVGMTVFRFDEGTVVGAPHGRKSDRQITLSEGKKDQRIESSVPVEKATFLGVDSVLANDEAFLEAERAFETLCRGMAAFGQARGVGELVEKCMDIALEMMSADEGFLALTRGTPRALEVAVVRPEGERAEKITVGSGVLERVMDEGLAVLAVEPRAAGGGAPRSGLYVPLKSAGEVLGLLRVGRSDPAKRFILTDLNRLCVLANHAATALENVLLQKSKEESEGKYRTLFQDSLEGMSVTIAGKIVDVNPAWLELHGFASKDEVLGTDIINIVHPDDRGSLRKRRDMWSGDQRRIYELRDVRKDGGLVDVELYSNTIVLDGREAILTAVRDVTERNRARKALRESEEKYRTIFEDSLEAMSLTIGGKIVDVNAAWLELHGFKDKKEIVGADIMTVVHPDDRDVFLRRRGAFDGGQRRTYELRDIGKDGRVIDVELYSNTILLDGKEAILSTVRDITERKRAKNALRESEEKYRTLFEDSLEAMSLTIRGKMVDVNGAWLRLHGFQGKDQVMGMEVMDVIHPDDRHVLARRRQLAAKDRPRVYELRDVRADGSAVDVEVYSSAIQIGGELAILSTVHDITERKQMQQEILQSSKLAALGTMISGVAHEINNPLSAICAFAYLLEEDKAISSAAHVEIQNILQEVERCSHIVENLLRFARRDPGRKEMVNINEVMMNSIDLRRYDMEVSNIQVVEEYDPDLPKVYGNAHNLQQVFLNIINNAYDAITERKVRGRIVLRTRHMDSRVSIEIEDNAGGMKEPHRVFEPFYTTKEVGKGTGLGLSVAYGIVGDHNGAITAENTAEGARFVIRLPIMPDRAEKAKKQEEAATVPPSPGKRVLVVDDEKKVANAIHSLLARLGYIVHTCNSPTEAVAVLKSSDFDVVVSDLVMPGDISARDMYNWIKANKPGLADRVIFITGSTTQTRTKHLLEGINNPVIFKPFRREEICNAVNEAAARA